MCTLSMTNAAAGHIEKAAARSALGSLVLSGKESTCRRWRHRSVPDLGRAHMQQSNQARAPAAEPGSPRSAQEDPPQ